MTATDTTALGTSALAREHATLTERCGLVDRSERGKLALTGRDAVEFLNGQVTNELIGLKPGKGCYAAFLTYKGKMLGDLRILAVGDIEAPGSEHQGGDAEAAELLLDTERVALQALFDMIRRFKVGYDVELHKRTLESALLSLIGPSAEEVVARAFSLGPSDPGIRGSAERGSAERPPHTHIDGMPVRENDHLPSHLGATSVRLIRTNLGFDLLFEAQAIDPVHKALMDAGAVAISEAAAEILRVEQGRPRYGLDLDESTIPQEAGLNERAVSFTKGCYVGQETVARLHYKGKPNRHLRGLRLSEPVQPGSELRLGEKSVGHLGSTVVSPDLGPIGLALVRREAGPGATVLVGVQGAEATVVELPFA
jgi:folate-binding protein YgfZ